MGVKKATATAPTTAAMGSTTADSCPYQKLLKRETPCLLKGIETANPSGKF